MEFRFCVCLLGLTAKHALEHGFRTVLIEDACRGVAQSNIDKTKEELRALGAVIVDSSEVSYGCFYEEESHCVTCWLPGIHCKSHFFLKSDMTDYIFIVQRCLNKP